MEKIQFDSGVKEYRINGTGVLKFNPADPNIYARFLEAVEKISALEERLVKKANQQSEGDVGTQAIGLMEDVDKQIKEILGWVFGNGNDFDKILGGVNLLAVAGNGERVVTNLFDALQPVLIAGAEACVRDQTEKAVKKAKNRRAQTEA